MTARPRFAEHKVLTAADLEDERAYLDDAYTRHLDRVHGTNGSVLVAASVVHPTERTAVGLGPGPGGDALTVSVVDGGGRLAERVRITGPASPPGPAQLVFAEPAATPATGPSPGTLTLLAGVGKPAATELRIEAPASKGPGRIAEFRYAGNPVRRPLAIEADGTVRVGDLEVQGELARGPAPTPAGPTTSDATGSVAAAEALRQELAQGLGIGADTGIGVAFANASVAGGHVRFTVEVTDVQGVAPVSITIKGRVNVGAAVVAEDLGLLPAILAPAQMLRRAVDIALPPAAKGDVIAAITAYGIHPAVGLVSASEARMLGTVV
jgi:hypothetical protein